MKPGRLTYIAQCLLLIPVLGVVSFSLSKLKWTNELYENLELGLHKDKLLTLCYSPDEYKKLNWIGEREFILDDQWYDVVEKEKTGDEYLLTVYPDHEEKEWFANFFSTKKSESHNTDNFKEQIFKFNIFQDLIIALKDLPICCEQFGEVIDITSNSFTHKYHPPPKCMS